MVHPTKRDKGYGTKLLAMTLKKAQQMGLNSVLMTCNSDNIASARVIQVITEILSGQLPLFS